ncbi:hypothetical protein [Salinarchaeum laminariae]|uniref:hypothetical protein n=1 Tax=Salinarchaeum laminariae TaxID=869888 RepID=UPI0020C00502|nr:hypothetical protein [Salinarchaeum laminariae]
MVTANPDQRAAWKLLAVVLMAIALLGSLILIGGTVAAQEQVGNETTVPGVDAGENRTITTTIDWNASADAATDSATIEIRFVGESYQDPSISTTNETVTATPGETTVNATTLSPSSAVDTFAVNVTATTASAVDDVTVSSDASSGGGGGTTGGGSGGTILGGIVGIALVGAVGYWWRDR